MNKKLIVFICILSLLVPLFPSFNLIVSASDSVSDDDVNGGGGGHSRNNTYTGILGQFNQYLLNNGYVLNDSSTITYNVLDSVLEDNFGVDLEDYVSIYEPTDYASIYNNFATQNPDFDFDELANLLNQFGLDYVYSQIPYNIYTVYHKSDLKSLIYNIGNQEASWLTKFTLPSDDNCIYFVYVPNNYLVWGDSNNSNPLEVISVPLDMFENYQFYCKTNNFSSEFFNTDNFYYKVPITDNNMTKTVFTFWCVSDNNIPNTLTFNQRTYYVWSGSLGSSQPTSRSYFAYLPLYSYCSTNRVYNYLYGGFFIAPDNIDTFSFAIYKDYASVFNFLNGDSQVYKFDTNLTIPSDLPDNFNYQRLYDLISDSLANSTGNAVDIINTVADKYLQQQIDLLHDINNALNDGNGQSWLRRIYGILDYNFPLTLQAFEDLQHAIQNISFSGGGSDLTHINRVIDEINDKLGFMIEDPLNDADIQDMEDLKNLAQQKFPFCVFSDIVAISVILNQPPEQPHWQIPLKLPGSSSVNNIEVDLSWYENVRDLVQGVFIFIFIVGLLALSVKIFSALKS